MKNIISAILLIFVALLVYQCGNDIKPFKPFNNTHLIGLGLAPDSILYYQERDSNLNRLFESPMSEDITYRKNSVFISLVNKGAVQLGKGDIASLDSTEFLDLDLLIDSTLQGKIFGDIEKNQEMINLVLNKLNSGYQVNFIPDTISLSSVTTDGTVNTNKVIRQINKLHTSTGMFTVCLFNSSEFFNTANAIAIKGINDDKKEQNLILGNGVLLESPYLFAHELFHALGLTHYNGLYDNCTGSGINEISLSNVMNESNIGCSRRLSARQIAIMNTEGYIPKLVEDELFPKGLTCDCNFAGLNSEVEQYLNSFDRNIDDTPLVGNDDLFFETIDALENDILSGEARESIQNNYEKEASELGLGGADFATYVSKRLAIHEQLRLYNLCRWLKENTELKGDSMPEDFWELNPINLIPQMVQYYDQTQGEYCTFRCGNNKCETDYFNCDSCPKADEQSAGIQEREVDYNLSKKAYVLNSFGNIVLKTSGAEYEKEAEQFGIVIDMKKTGNPVIRNTKAPKTPKKPTKSVVLKPIGKTNNKEKDK